MDPTKSEKGISTERTFKNLHGEGLKTEKKFSWKPENSQILLLYKHCDCDMNTISLGTSTKWYKIHLTWFI